ncbi:translation initiation factor eIF-2B subunit beta [Toxorhynchites rutilus septentrionalis]|uniref:translation initiation factor eIF-2B subunit beta n=1 Tax=Toxorhynchites rutilus septentrionalis TaxID=329112 RepID=UPI00247AB48A|nr:translation initiation factor eIF-2B subunit beta [Toxorhynchites rutilus septentrionalis]
MTGQQEINLTPEIAQFIRDIRLNNIVGSHKLTSKTLALFTNHISKSEWTTAERLMTQIRQQGQLLVAALPQDIVIANTVRRILKIIREEYDSAQLRVHFDDAQTALSLHKLVTQTSEQKLGDYSQPQEGLKEAVLEHLSEIESELETCADNLSVQATEHIHSAELIMTIGHSKSVEKFLRKAAENRTIEVIVAECAPACKGHQLAVNLGKAKIQTTLIPDSAIFAMMSRVNKVIIGTHCVLANGGLRAVCGAYSLALAAKHYSVPVIVLAPTYKLTPVHLSNYDQDDFNILGNTEGVIPYNSPVARFAKAYNPVFDYVPPELVTLFITNSGGNAPSYIYRLLSELYHPDDNEL